MPVLVGDGSDRRKIHWINLKRMCIANEKGGMGFRDMERFIVALLARQGWRLLQKPDSLLVKMLQARYYPSSNFMGAKLGYRPSYAWRSLIQGRELLRKDLL